MRNVRGRKKKQKRYAERLKSIYSMQYERDLPKYSTVKNKKLFKKMEKAIDEVMRDYIALRYTSTYYNSSLTHDVRNFLVNNLLRIRFVPFENKILKAWNYFFASKLHVTRRMKLQCYVMLRKKGYSKTK